MILVAALESRARMLLHTMIPVAGKRSPGGANASRTAFVLALALAGLAFLVMRELLSMLIQAGGTVDEAATLVAVLVNLTLAGLLVFDLHEGVSALLADSDLDLLRRAPIPPHVLLAIKLLDALPRTSILLVVLVVPAALAFHEAFGLAAWGWVLLPVQMLSLWALPFGVGVAAAVLLLRIVPARHAREALGLVSSLTLLALWLANSFLLPRVGMSSAPIDDLRGSLAQIARALSATPGGWLAASLDAAAARDTLAAFAATARLAIAAAIAIALVVWVAHGHLELVQARVMAMPAHRGPGGARRRPARAEPESLERAMLVRDAHLIARHWTILGDLITTVVLWTLLPVVVGPLFETSHGLLARSMLLALAVAVGSEVAARALPLERGGLAWSRLVPVTAARWLAARLLGAALISAVLIALATAVSAWALGLSAAELAGLLGLLVPALVLSLGTGLWAGVSFGDQAWTNPRAMLRPAGRIVSTLLLLAQAVAWISLASHAEAGGIASFWRAALAAVLAVALAALAFAAGARRLGRTRALLS